MKAKLSCRNTCAISPEEGHILKGYYDQMSRSVLNDHLWRALRVSLQRIYWYVRWALILVEMLCCKQKPRSAVGPFPKLVSYFLPGASAQVSLA